MSRSATQNLAGVIALFGDLIGMMTAALICESVRDPHPNPDPRVTVGDPGPLGVTIPEGVSQVFWSTFLGLLVATNLMTIFIE